MRSSKSRSRSKSNRNRSVGNIVNRVFDSSGPEGKVRGTPQQIIEKYNQLARDAQLSNDRVATENFQQHSEHYTRLLGEAQREAEARREQQEAQNRERQREREEARAQSQQDMPDDTADAQVLPEPEQRDPMPMEDVEGLGDVVDLAGTNDSGLVDTPESKPRRPRRPRKPKETQSAEAKVVNGAAEDTAAQEASQDSAPDAEPSDPEGDDPVRPEAAE